MKNYTKNFKRFMLFAAMFIISIIASSLLWSEVLVFNDGHCYFTARNTYNTSGVIKSYDCNGKHKHSHEHCEFGNNGYDLAQIVRKQEDEC